MIPHTEITPGYYWATYGPYPASIVYVEYNKRKSALQVMFHGLSDRCPINKFVLHERIKDSNYQHPIGDTNVEIIT